jgi:hypothetical protein
VTRAAVAATEAGCVEVLAFATSALRDATNEETGGRGHDGMPAPRSRGGAAGRRGTSCGSSVRRKADRMPFIAIE